MEKLSCLQLLPLPLEGAVICSRVTWKDSHPLLLQPLGNQKSWGWSLEAKMGHF